MVSVLTEEETAVLSTLTDRIKEYQTEIALLRSLQTHMEKKYEPAQRALVLPSADPPVLSSPRTLPCATVIRTITSACTLTGNHLAPNTGRAGDATFVQQLTDHINHIEVVYNQIKFDMRAVRAAIDDAGVTSWSTLSDAMDSAGKWFERLQVEYSALAFVPNVDVRFV
jgi:hypothetical protein